MEENKFNSKDLIAIYTDFYFFLLIKSKNIGYEHIFSNYSSTSRYEEIEDDNGFNFNSYEFHEHLKEVKNQIEHLYLWGFNQHHSILSVLNEIDIPEFTKTIQTDNVYLISDFKRYLNNSPSLREFFNTIDDNESIEDNTFNQNIDEFEKYLIASKATIKEYSLVSIIYYANKLKSTIQDRYEFKKNNILNNLGNVDHIGNSPYINSLKEKLEYDIEQFTFEGSVHYIDIIESTNSKGVAQIFNVCEALCVTLVNNPSSNKKIQLAYDILHEKAWTKSFYEWICNQLDETSLFTEIENRAKQGKTKKVSAGFQYSILENTNLINRIKALDIQKQKMHGIIAMILGCEIDSAKKLFNGKYKNQNHSKQDALELLEKYNLLE